MLLLNLFWCNKVNCIKSKWLFNFSWILALQFGITERTFNNFWGFKHFSLHEWMYMCDKYDIKQLISK